MAHRPAGEPSLPPSIFEFSLRLLFDQYGVAGHFPSYVQLLSACSSLPANALGGSVAAALRHRSLRHLLVASARSGGPNLLACLSVSSLNPAGNSSSSYVFLLPTTQDPRRAGVLQTRGRKRATCGISALFVYFSSSNSFAKAEKLKRYFLWEPLVCLGVCCKYNF